MYFFILFSWAKTVESLNDLKKIVSKTLCAESDVYKFTYPKNIQWT